jgi:hypothetical protein
VGVAAGGEGRKHQVVEETHGMQTQIEIRHKAVVEYPHEPGR